jgi:YVTN family beta-propeller protein
VSVIDAGSQRTIAEIAVGRRPWGIAVTADGRHIYTANGLSNDVTVIDAGTLRVTGRLRAGTLPWGVVAR